MFFKAPSRKKGILIVEDNFVRLKQTTKRNADSNVTNPSSQDVSDQIHCVFTYKISQLKALEENALSVLITVRTKNRNKDVILKNYDSKKDIADKITSNQTRISNSDAGSVILRLYSDITSGINNQLIQNIKEKKDIESEITKSKLTLRSIKHVNENSLRDSVIVSSTGFFDNSLGKTFSNNNSLRIDTHRSNVSTMFRELLMKEIAPSDVTLQNDRTNSAFELSQGLSKQQKRREYVGDPSKDILSVYLYDAEENAKNLSERSEEELVTTFEQVTNSIVEIKNDVKIPNDLLTTNPVVIVKFDLIKNEIRDSGTSSDYVLESVERFLDLTELLRENRKVIKPPIIKKSNDNSRIFLSIQQMDENANVIEIYRKNVNENNYSEFEKIEEVKISKKDGAMSLSYDNLGHQYSIFRAVAKTTFDSVDVNHEFADVVVTNKRGPRNLVLVPTITRSGITITAYNNNPEIKIAKLLFRNVSIHNTQFISVDGGTFYFPKENSQESITLTDLTPHQIYEFTTRITDIYGNEYDSSYSVHIEMLKYSNDSLKVMINDGSNTINATSVANSDFSFSCTATLQEDPKTQIRSGLAGMSSDYGLGGTQTSKNQIYDKLIFFMITRYDITSGEISNLGIVGNGTVVIDSEQSKKFLANNLLAGHEYTYVIQPMIRDPENTASEPVTMKDQITKKNYIMSPQRHRHPSRLLQGLIFSEEQIKNDVNHPGLYGKLGISYTLNITRKSQKFEITDVKASLENKTCVISWSITGETSGIDHFVIMKVNENCRSVIGKAHCINAKSIKFIYELSEKDIGVNHYVLMPVSSNFELGTSIKTNKIFVEETDLMVN